MEKDSQFEKDVSELVNRAIKRAVTEVKIEDAAKSLVEDVKRKAIAKVYVMDVIIPGAVAKMEAEARGTAEKTNDSNSVQERADDCSSNELTSQRSGNESERTVRESVNEDVTAERSVVNAAPVKMTVRDVVKDLLKEVVHMVNGSALKSEDLQSNETRHGDEHLSTGTLVDSPVKTSNVVSRNMGEGDNMSSVEIYFSVKDNHTNLGNTNPIYSTARKIKSGSDIGASQHVDDKQAHSTVSAHLDENGVLPEYYTYFTQQSTNKESRSEQGTEARAEDVILKTKKQSRWSRGLHNAVGYLRNLFRCHRSAKASRAEAYVV